MPKLCLFVLIVLGSCCKVCTRHLEKSCVLKFQPKTVEMEVYTIHWIQCTNEFIVNSFKFGSIITQSKLNFSNHGIYVPGWNTNLGLKLCILNDVQNCRLWSQVLRLGHRDRNHCPTITVPECSCLQRPKSLHPYFSPQNNL